MIETLWVLLGVLIGWHAHYFWVLYIIWRECGGHTD